MRTWAKIGLASLLCFSAGEALFSEEVDELQFCKRVNAHLLLHDSLSAVQEAKKAVVLYPSSKPLHLALIRALCEKGDEVEALQWWQKTTALFKEEENSRHLLEILAWGVLNKGETSPQLMIRISSLLGTIFTRDAKAVPVLIAQMRDTHALLRSIAVRFAAMYGDEPLQKELRRLLKEEKVWYVRLEVIKAVGQIKMVAARDDLKEIIGNPKTLAEEKAAAIVSLVEMYDRLDASELKGLVKSNRAGLRQLACELIAHLDLKEYIPEILPLLKDNSPDVRMAVVSTVGLLRVEKVGDRPMVDILRPLLRDAAPEVSITAAWASLILGSEEGKESLKHWMQDANPEWRRLASAALSVTGRPGCALSLETMRTSSDPYVKVNLALGLIGQRYHIRESCNTIYDAFFKENQVKWMWDDHINPLFRSLSPSRVRHVEQIPHYPMIVDQLVRLEVLSTLSVMRYAKAEEAIKSYLQTQAWGVSGAAAAALLEEGNEQSMEMVQGLLNDPEEKIRLQAALILALLGGDRSALKVLHESYPKVDRETQIYILEALAHIGDTDSLPFLIDILKEPYQLMRVIAASAIIQCLYH